MKRASAIVTNRGGRTCHAAIIARELGYTGCCRLRRSATEDDQRRDKPVTVSCAEGDEGFVYEGAMLEFERQQIDARFTTRRSRSRS